MVRAAGHKRLGRKGDRQAGTRTILINVATGERTHVLPYLVDGTGEHVAVTRVAGVARGVLMGSAEFFLVAAAGEAAARRIAAAVGI